MEPMQQQDRSVAMPAVTFQVLEGIDKGRSFRDLPTPVSIGREEGNIIRLNDERVSRFHAKVLADNDEIILTDLESTNGTRVNGSVVQIRRLRPGDRLGIGRSVLLFGSEAEIDARRAALAGANMQPPTVQGSEGSVSATLQANALAAQIEQMDHFDLNPEDKITHTKDGFFHGKHALPVLPEKLTPSQAARLAEILDFLHNQLTSATDQLRANDDGTQIILGYNDWQRIQSIHLLLAKYARAVTEPDAMTE
jgi:predicted component of type VI protein secretion system